MSFFIVKAYKMAHEKEHKEHKQHTALYRIPWFLKINISIVQHPGVIAYEHIRNIMCIIEIR